MVSFHDLILCKSSSEHLYCPRHSHPHIHLSPNHHSYLLKLRQNLKFGFPFASYAYYLAPPAAYRYSAMQKLIFLPFFLFLSVALLAQNSTLSGTIKDSLTRKGVEYATIKLATASGKQVLYGATSDSTGKFTIPGVSIGLYTVQIEAIGYGARTIDSFRVSGDGKTSRLRNIALLKQTNTLQGVVVTSTGRKLVENRIDKVIFNAENDISSAGGVATDVLKKVPQVTVDADGNVELSGAGGVRFLINGKPSTIFGNNITDVLQSIPASQIKSIEVVTNPGARYSAEGTAGVINIILKNSKVNGTNSSVSLTAGTRNENGSYNLTVRHNNFGLHASVSGNTRLNALTPGTLDRTTVDTATQQDVYLHQQSRRHTHRYSMQGGLGFDWTIDSLNSLSGDVNYEKFAGGGSGLQTQQQRYVPFAAGGAESVMNILNNSGFSWEYYGTDASLAYQRKFKKEDETLDVTASTSFGHNRGKSRNVQTLLPEDSVYYGVNNNNYGPETNTEISADYNNPFSKKVVFGAGARMNLNHLRSTADVLSLQPDTKGYGYDSSLSNSLTYRQNVYAAYAELSFPAGKWFDVKAGMRYERTQTDAYFSQATQQVGIPGYNTWVPSAYLLRKLGEHQTLKLSYSKRIGRPEYDNLNPFINTTDPKNITTGNPYLKPERGYRAELAYNHEYGSAGSFLISAFYRQSNGDIQPYTYYYPTYKVGDSVYSNVSLSTTENIGTEQNLGVNLFGEMKASGKLNFRTNIALFRRYIENGIDVGGNRTSYNFRSNLNGTYQISKVLVAEAFGSFNSARNEVQGRYPSFTTYTMAVRKQFWNKKGSLALTATNLFANYVRQRTELYGVNFTTYSERDIPTRSIGLNFTWKFGKLEFKKEDKDREESGGRDGGS